MYQPLRVFVAMFLFPRVHSRAIILIYLCFIICVMYFFCLTSKIKNLIAIKRFGVISKCLKNMIPLLIVFVYCVL